MFKFSKNKLLSYLILIITMSFAIYLVKDRKDVLVKVFDINFFQFLVLSVLVLITGYINGSRIKILTRQFGVNLGNKESFALAIVNTFWNYLPLTGGLVARGVYLKKRHNFSYTSLISTVVSSYIISFLSFSLVGLLSVIWIWQDNGIFNPWIAAVFSLAALFSLIMIKVNINLKFRAKILKPLSKIISEWKILRTRKKLILNLFLLDLALIIITALRFYFAGQFLGSEVPFIGLLIISSLTLFAILLNITPGALVIREAIISFGVAALSYSSTVGLTISLLDRAVALFWIFLLGVIFTVLFLRPYYRGNVGD